MSNNQGTTPPGPGWPENAQAGQQPHQQGQPGQQFPQPGQQYPQPGQQYPQPGQQYPQPGQQGAPQYAGATQQSAPAQAPGYQQHQQAPGYPAPSAAPGAYPGPNYAASPQQPPKKTLIWPWAVGGSVAVVALVVGAIFVVGALSAQPDIVALPDPAPITTEADDPTSDAPAADEPSIEEDDMAAVMAERDAFFAAQQFVLDGSMPTAKTQPQRDFLASEHVKSANAGLVPDETSDAVALALTSDLCETAILNHHQIDSDILFSHVATSPLISQILASGQGEDTTPVERGLIETAINGSSYLCPQDHDQWMAAYTALYGG